jgi:PAS domain S-box-containing protein
MTLPIKKSGQIIGSFNLYSTIANLFDSKEIALLEEIADDISFALDVFEKERIRKQMEELLIHSELHLKQAQAIAHFGSWETDFAFGLTTWSEETCRIFGVHPSNNRFTQKAWLQFVHPDDREKVSELIGAISNEKKDDTFYYRIVRADGAVRHIHSHYHFEYDGHGQPKGMFGVAHDITDTRVAIEALAQSEANLRLIIDLLPQAIFAKNTEGRYVFMNNKFASIYGATPKDMIGKSATEINFDKNEVRASLEEDQEVLRLGKAQAKKINYITDYKGVTHIYNTIKVPFTVAGKNEKAILGVAIDITEQIKAEAERTKIIADIVQRNKDLEQFSYIVSHNLRSPLANIIGISEIMKLSTTMQPDDAALLGDLLISVNRLDEVIKDLNHILQIKHSDGRDKEKVVFADLVDSIKSSIRNLIQVDDVRIIEDFSQVGAMITLKTYIYSIFFNLISNSIKYRKPDTQPVISITSSQQNGKLLITFKDNGMGIDMEKNGANIFGLYKRFHSHVDGKGVGLFMVKTQVETLGGTISLSSKVNEGTEFHLEFASY